MGILRLFLAISVVVAHTGAPFGVEMMPSFAAVRLFFIVSGFYMSLVLSGKYEGRDQIWVFYTNRFLRLYPAYFIAVLLMTAVYIAAAGLSGAAEKNALVTEIQQQASGGGTLDAGSLVAMLIPNLTIFGSDIVYLFHHTATGWMLTFGIDPANHPDAVRGSVFLLIAAAWSIGIELWFYLLAPFFMRLRTGVIAAIGLASLILHLGMDEWRPWSNYCFFPAALWFFMLGILAHRFWLSNWFKQHVDLRTAWIAAGVGLSLIMLREFIPGFRNYPGASYVALTIALPFIFEAFRKIAWDRWIGNLSYPVYLFHSAVIVVAHNHFHTADFLPIIAATLLISGVVNLGVEEPLERYRQRRAARHAKGRAALQESVA